VYDKHDALYYVDHSPWLCAFEQQASVFRASCAALGVSDKNILRIVMSTEAITKVLLPLCIERTTVCEERTSARAGAASPTLATSAATAARDGAGAAGAGSALTLELVAGTVETLAKSVSVLQNSMQAMLAVLERNTKAAEAAIRCVPILFKNSYFV